MLQLSKTAWKILSFLMTNPEKEYYLRELMRIIKSTPRPVQLALAKLEERKIIQSKPVANLKYYQVNKNHALYPELKKIIFKTTGLAGNLADKLATISGIKTAFIYGSFAKEEERADSDIDLFIIGEPNEDSILKIINQKESDFHREINYIIYDPTDYQKKKNNRDGFILDVLNNPKIFLIGGENDLQNNNRQT